jgi:hypothetical protein
LGQPSIAALKNKTALYSKFSARSARRTTTALPLPEDERFRHGSEEVPGEWVERLAVRRYFDASAARRLGRSGARSAEVPDGLELLGAACNELDHGAYGELVPSTIFAKLQNERAALDASARHYKFDIVL